MNIVVEDLKSSDVIEASEDFYIKWIRRLVNQRPSSIEKLCIYFTPEYEDCIINSDKHNNKCFTIHIERSFASYSSSYWNSAQIRELPLHSQMRVCNFYPLHVFDNEALYAISRFVNYYSSMAGEETEHRHARRTQLEIYLCFKNIGGENCMNFMFIEKSPNCNFMSYNYLLSPTGLRLRC